METEIVVKLTKSFEESSHKDEDGVEFWYARELQVILGYKDWRNFSASIEKAKISCEVTSGNTLHHFVDVNNPIVGGKGAIQDRSDFKLTRLACYLIAQNGDPRKDAIAVAQLYFATQTRRQEKINEHYAAIKRLDARDKLTKTEKLLSLVLYEHGIDSEGFAIIRSKGDKALFGGNDTRDMKKKLGVPNSRALADYLAAPIIIGKEFAAAITTFNTKEKDLANLSDISDEHVTNNSNVRDLLLKSNIIPEKIPPQEDIRKVEKRIKNEAALIEHIAD